MNSVVNSSNKPNRKLRVGVTIHIREGYQTIWENGISQNCLFLVQLLNLSPEVERAVLINGSGVKEVSKGMFIEAVDIPMISLEEAQETLDVVIEMGQQLAYEWVTEFKGRGGRYVFMRVGCDYVIDIERAMFALPPASLCNNTPYDAIWTIPVHERTCKDYFSLTCRAPVRVVPHIWTPQFFDIGNQFLPEEYKYGYKGGKDRWRICSFESNINTVKTSIIPMLVCEEAYRKNPHFLEFFRICNTYQMRENPIFTTFGHGLDIVNHGLATFEGRFPMYEYLARNGDCIIAHQWECELNYAYYEALYGNYPLIHNSELLKEYGYYYPNFDCQKGGEALLRAFNEHDQNLDSYRSNCSELIAELSVNNPQNIDRYSAELRYLYDPVLLREELEIQSGLSAENPKLVDSIMVINLDRRKDRWEKFTTYHPDLAKIAIREKACDGRQLKLTPSLARLFKPNTFQWKKSVMGCAISHLNLWWKICNEPDDINSYLILEDDARLRPEWVQAWQTALHLDAIPKEFDIIFFGGVLPPNKKIFESVGVEKINEFISKVRDNMAFGQNTPNRRFHFCAYSYVITKAGAKKLLKILEDHDGYYVPADHIICDHPDQLKIFFFHPFLAGCFQDDDPIYQNSQFDKNLRVDEFDSDLWNNVECFEDAEIAAHLAANADLDIAKALRDAGYVD